MIKYSMQLHKITKKKKEEQEKKNKYNIRSILNDVLKEINQLKDEKKIKEICYKRIKKSKINIKDKNKMLFTISNKKGYYKTIKCIYDLILKYEGEGVIK